MYAPVLARAPGYQAHGAVHTEIAETVTPSIVIWVQINISLSHPVFAGVGVGGGGSCLNVMDLSAPTVCLSLSILSKTPLFPLCSDFTMCDQNH